MKTRCNCCGLLNLWQWLELFDARISRCVSPLGDQTRLPTSQCRNWFPIQFGRIFSHSKNRISVPQQNEPKYIYGYVINFLLRPWVQNLSQHIFQLRLSRCSTPTPEKSGQGRLQANSMYTHGHGNVRVIHDVIHVSCSYEEN